MNNQVSSALKQARRWIDDKRALAEYLDVMVEINDAIPRAEQMERAFDEMLAYIEGYALSADEDDPVHEVLPRYRAIKETGL